MFHGSTCVPHYLPSVFHGNWGRCAGQSAQGQGKYLPVGCPSGAASGVSERLHGPLLALATIVPDSRTRIVPASGLAWPLPKEHKSCQCLGWPTPCSGKQATCQVSEVSAHWGGERGRKKANERGGLETGGRGPLGKSSKPSLFREFPDHVSLPGNII